MKFHSTETALLEVQNNILLNIDKQEITLLVLLDLSSAFDTIDHAIMLDILQHNFGYRFSPEMVWIFSMPTKTTNWCGPVLWNKLPDFIRTTILVYDLLKLVLKLTYLISAHEYFYSISAIEIVLLLLLLYILYYSGCDVTCQIMCKVPSWACALLYPLLNKAAIETNKMYLVYTSSHPLR